MNRRILAAAFAATILVPTLLRAQDDRGGSPRFYSFSRPRIGVSLNMQADSESDRYGAKVQSVVPGGPAEKAGIKAGDIITRFNGTSLAGSASGDEDSRPGPRLVGLASKLEAGDTVKVEYRRGSETRTATIIADNMKSEFALNGDGAPWQGMPDMEAFPKMEGQMFDRMPGGNFQFMMDGPSSGLDLVPLNADLGEYFGTSEGLLVARAPADSSLPLRAGDVLLSIDGRKPTSEAHAMRILHSYDDGETVKLEVMRKHQRVNIDWKVKTPEMHFRSYTPFRNRTPEPGRTRERL